VYSTCLFCHASLGANEVVEHFPIGRRLAFDAGKGRLWVVCAKCTRWNLTPIEERWEAIEECERLFRDTRLRASTEHIGLARVREGLELVRIGRPDRGEFAAWRYGDQFLRRRRRSIAHASLAAAFGTVYGVWVGAVALPAVFAFGAFGLLSARGQSGDLFLPAPDGDGYLPFSMQQALETRLVAHPEAQSGWALDLAHGKAVPRPWTFWTQPALSTVIKTTGRVRLVGADATHTTARMLAWVNSLGGSPTEVADAVRELDAAGGPERVFSSAAARSSSGEKGGLLNLPRTLRLALEMAANEETERRAMAGELASLERAWRDAERIAAVADDLLLPRGVSDALAKLRGR
jgi:hypothetical protein